MSYVNRRIAELRESGIYGAKVVDAETISRIVNMEEYEYYTIDPSIIESYLGILAQRVEYVQQEVNIAAAREIELGNDFKMHALPHVLQSKIRSVDERWQYAASISDELKLKFDMWQRAIIEATLKKDLPERMIEKINVLKKIYDDRRIQGPNKHINKYTDGSLGG